MNVEEIIKTDRLDMPAKTVIHLFLVHSKSFEAITQALKPFQVSMQQFNVLRILRGQKGRPANLSTINGRMVSKMSNTTRLIDKLLLKGFVNRKVCPQNRRKVEITITEEGLNTLKAMDVAVAEAEQQLVENLSQNELEQLNTLLGKFNNPN